MNLCTHAQNTHTHKHTYRHTKTHTHTHTHRHTVRGTAGKSNRRPLLLLLLPLFNLLFSSTLEDSTIIMNAQHFFLDSIINTETSMHKRTHAHTHTNTYSEMHTHRD